MRLLIYSVLTLINVSTLCAQVGKQVQPYSKERSMEWLDRGVIAIPAQDKGVFVSWRLLVSEYGKDIAFHIYRNGKRITQDPITGKTNFVDTKANRNAKNIYKVETIFNGKSTISKSVSASKTPYLSFPIQKPGPIKTVTGEAAHYYYNDMGVADVDGDGEYEIIVRWHPSIHFDKGRDLRPTGPAIFDAYKMDGTALWRINMGYNITTSYHYNQFLFYDFDEDGKAEFVIKVADGTKSYAPDKNGRLPADPYADGLKPVSVIGNPSEEGKYVITTGNVQGRVSNQAREYLAAFNGKTGQLIHCIDYPFPVGSSLSWGATDGKSDDNYNRSDRFNAAVAYLPHPQKGTPYPAIVQQRGYYGRTAVAAFFLLDGKLETAWKFDTNDYATAEEKKKYESKGVHTCCAADVDGDGFDEFLIGALTLDHDGSVYWVRETTTTNDYHGDAFLVGAMSPYTRNLQSVMPYENITTPFSHTITDIATGMDLYAPQRTLPEDMGRAMAANITPKPGFEVWSMLYTTKPKASNQPPFELENLDIYGPITDIYGNYVADIPSDFFSAKARLYWDGDLLSELLDGKGVYSGGHLEVSKGGAGEHTGTTPYIYKYNWKDNRLETIDEFKGAVLFSGTTPGLTADIFGDWREEVLVADEANSEIRIYTTNYETGYMIYTLMHDPNYRLAIVRQNSSYNQSPTLGYYLGEDIAEKVLHKQLPIFPQKYTNIPE